MESNLPILVFKQLVFFLSVLLQVFCNVYDLYVELRFITFLIFNNKQG